MVRRPGTVYTQYGAEAVVNCFNLLFDSVPDTTGYLGAAGMVSIELVEPGVAWVDDLHFGVAPKLT